MRTVGWIIEGKDETFKRWGLAGNRTIFRTQLSALERMRELQEVNPSCKFRVKPVHDLTGDD